MTEVIDNRLYGCLWYGDNLGVHGVLVGICYLHGLEGTCTHMQGHFGGLNAALTQSVQYFVGKMQACSRCCYRTLDTRIDSLISGLVALLRLAVEVWRNR